MHFLGLSVGKLTLRGLRLLGRTGSALPGRVVEKVSPNFLAGMLAQLPQGVIIISGTNGKTTTTKLVTKLLESQGLRVLTNPTGSNFVRGIISSVVDKASWGGKLDYDIAVFEQDEAHAVHFARAVQPRGVLVLNVMRDQMDRFGEIDTTLKLLETLASSATEFVALNANDERVSTICAGKPSCVWFGHSRELQAEFLTDDQLYHAESADFFQAAKPSVELTGYDEESVSLRVSGVPHRYRYHLQGGHNALNLAAALAVLYQTVPGPDTGKLAGAILTVEPAFGRGEVITLPSGGKLTLQLVKNPGGFTQALRMLELKDYQTVGIAINDDYPDGRDVSWLWDVDFSIIALPQGVRGPTSHSKAERSDLAQVSVLCGGVRAADMANRLKYDEVPVKSVEPDIGNYAHAFTQAVSSTDEAVLFCTYTAMLKLRSIYLGGSSGLDGGDS
jgi:UDP-N-acetylmuramyl tripeptide synthase